MEKEAENRKHDHGDNKFATPSIVGPGCWFTIHLAAYHAKTPQEIQQFISFLILLINNFKCLVCRGHAVKYLKNNPFDNFINLTLPSGEQIGMFKYTWIFHNVVNTRLGKPNIDWDTAYAMFADTEAGVCTKACDAGAHHDDVKTGNTTQSYGAMQSSNPIIQSYESTASKPIPIVTKQINRLSKPELAYGRNYLQSPLPFPIVEPYEAQSNLAEIMRLSPGIITLGNSKPKKILAPRNPHY